MRCVISVERDGQRPVRGYVDLLRCRPYLGLLLSRVVSLVGDQLARVALTVLVFQRTGSALLSAATYAATFLPVVVAGPLLGGLADRLPRRRLLVLADLVRAGLFALMALPGAPLGLLLALVLLAAAVEAPWAAARAPLMRDVLEDDQSYQLGTGLDETLDHTGQVLGFLAAGALLAVFSPSAALLLDAASFLVSAVVVRALIPVQPAADPSRARPAAMTGRFREGRAARARQALADAAVGWRAAMGADSRRPVLLTWVGISCSVAPEALAAPWASELGVGPFGTGLLFAAGPVGSVLGLLLVGRVSPARAERLLLPLAVLTVAPLLACLAGPPLHVALVLVMLSGLGSSFSMLARVAFVRAVTGAHRGRAFSIAAAGVTAGQGLGIAVAGGGAAVAAPSQAVGLCGGVGLLLLAAVHRLTRPAASTPLTAGSPAASTARHLPPPARHRTGKPSTTPSAADPCG